MISAASKIKTAIEKTLKDLNLEVSSIEITHPSYEIHGDYSTNTALKGQSLKGLSFKTFKNPRELAQIIVNQLNKDKELKEVVSKIEIAGAGFINFWLKEDLLLNSLDDIKPTSDSEFLGKKVMVEYTDPNPFKEFHIGHLYSNTVGESLARIVKFLGADVKRACYQGDIGMHVAKSVWGMMEKMKNEELKMKNLEEMSLNERQHFMGQAYALGAKGYEKDKKIKKEIEELNKKIYAGDSEIKKYYEMGRKWSLEYFESIYKRLGTKFDFYYFESETGKTGLEFVREYLKKGVFKESDGAIIFEGEKYGLHNRVFINSLGLPTYEAKDLGLASKKYKDFAYDLSIIVTGNEVNDYFKVILKALEIINPDLSQKTKHIGHGMVRLPSGKMSSRTGKVLTGEWLLDETRKKALELIKKDEEKNVEEISEKVAVGAVKYSLLKSNIGKDVIFDFKESLAFDGNSGPYLQYTYARAKSILRKSPHFAHSVSLRASRGKQITNYKLLSEEKAIIRTLYKFPEVVVEAGKNFAPNLICNFLFDLAQKFNLFYQKVPIIKTQNSKLKTSSTRRVKDPQPVGFRLALTKITANIIKEGLNLLGIEVLEQM